MLNRRTFLQIEELESRVALSSYGSTLLAAPVAPLTKFEVVKPAPEHSQTLHGHLDGLYTTVHTIPDTGTQYDLTGSGFVQGLGVVAATGQLQSTGFIRNGHATGTLTLQNANGKVTLQLVGPTQPGFAPLPNQFHYTIVGATGAYAGMHGSGTVNLNIQSNPSGAGGTFSMSIS